MSLHNREVILSWSPFYYQATYSGICIRIRGPLRTEKGLEKHSYEMWYTSIKHRWI